MYGLTKPVSATEFTRLPERFRKPRRTAWGDANAAGQELDSFLEGPSFDRAGNLYVTDIPFGRIFRIDPAGDWTLVSEYDGWPNGLKIHKDGRIFITDYKRGVLLLDPATGTVTPLLETRRVSRASTISSLPPTAISISPTRARPACTIRPAGSTATTPPASSPCWSAPCRAPTASS